MKNAGTLSCWPRAGSTDALLLARGFSLEVILGIIGAKLATAATVERAGDKPVDVTRARITEAGRQERPKPAT